MIDNQIIVQFQHKILSWYEANARDLPWRKTTDPYEIWISESMLCQTQVSRVIDYYERWMKLFPDIGSLANATNEQVLKAWSGLGYNSRALRLKKAAEEVRSSKLGVLSYFESYDNLIALPGVGDYIANAVLAFAYNQDVVVIDTNIRRIILYEFASQAKRLKGEQANMEFDENLELSIENGELKELVWQTLPKGNARVWYNALMDYGALELTSKKTGIKPLTSQSKFIGSTRQVRASIIKHILGDIHGKIHYNQIIHLFPERSDIDSVISKMLKEGIIIKIPEDCFMIG